ncbi:MAG: hypothetical protein LBC61_00805 [Candidatus Peribacteria bacterium]|nr:hypothetical protein [Candidatus Peribacteria bacterium]
MSLFQTSVVISSISLLISSQEEYMLYFQLFTMIISWSSRFTNSFTNLDNAFTSLAK